MSGTLLYRRCTDHFAKLSNELGGGEWVDGYLLSRYVPLVRFRAEKRRRRVGRTTLSLSLSLSRWSKNSVTLELFDKTLARREVWSWRNSRACLFRARFLANLPLFIYSPWRVTSWRATLLVAEEKKRRKKNVRGLRYLVREVNFII